MIWMIEASAVAVAVIFYLFMVDGDMNDLKRIRTLIGRSIHNFDQADALRLEFLDLHRKLVKDFDSDDEDDINAFIDNGCSHLDYDDMLVAMMQRKARKMSKWNSEKKQD